MEKSNKEIEKSIYKLVKDAEVEQPSVNFLSNVMEAVTQQSIEQKVYQPLITKKVWFALAASLIIGIVLLTIFPSDSVGYLSQYAITDLFSVNISLPEIKASKTMMYGVAFLGLFLLQIPFIKYYHSKSYS